MDAENDLYTMITDQSKYAFIIKKLLQTGIYSRDSNKNTALHYAATGGHANLTKHLIEKGLNINVKNDNEDTALHCAATSGNMDVVKILLQYNAFIDVGNKLKNTALHCAVTKNHVDIAIYLIENGADIRIKNELNETAFDCISKDDMFKATLGEFYEMKTIHGNNCLHIAVVRNLIEEIDYCLQSKINYDVYNNDCLKPIELAIKLGRKSIVDMLFDRYGANRLNNLLCKAVEFNQIALVNYFLDRDADVDCRNVKNTSLLLMACRRGFIEIAKLLLEKQANIYAVDDAQWTVMHFAAYNASEEMVKLFINDKKLLNAKNSNSETALMLAVRNEDIAELLIDNGADIHITDVNSKSAIHHAAIAGCKNIVHMLLDRGIHCDLMAGENETPLHYAIYYHKYEVMELLLNRGAEITGLTQFEALKAGNVIYDKYFFKMGADINAIVKDNETVLLYSIKNDLESAAMYLLEKGADINCVDSELNSVMHYAAMKGYVKIITDLIHRGIDIDLKNNVDKTPLVFAVIESKVDAAALLIAHGAKKDILSNKDIERYVRHPDMKRLFGLAPLQHAVNRYL